MTNSKIFIILKGYMRGQWRKIFKFSLTHIPSSRKYLVKENSAGGSSSYCYGVWMKHLKHWALFNTALPLTVVEIGPGHSLGVGLAALISGSSKLYALERTQFWNHSTNLRVFDELVILFEKQTTTINVKDYFKIKQPLENFDFPFDMLSKEHLKKCLSKERLLKIRTELANPGNPENQYIQSIIPWNNSNIIPDASVDFIFSHTVLQHVDNLPDTYNSMSKWLKKDGCMSHTIDFQCMNVSQTWNGHWTLNETEWLIATGNDSLINREPFTSHLTLMVQNGFDVIFENRIISKNTLSSNDLAPQFKYLDDKDLTTSGAYIMARKK